MGLVKTYSERSGVSATKGTNWITPEVKIDFNFVLVNWVNLTKLFSLGNCTDVNECESPQACLYGECINNEGNYTCKCPPNYQLVAAGNACVG